MKKASQRLLISEAFCTLVLLNIKSMESKLEEIWKDITGYEGLYQISNLARVKSLRRWGVFERIKKPQKRVGYHGVRLFSNKHGQYYTIHRLVAIHFIPNPENKPQVNHKNGIRTDNRIDNLEWCTAYENTMHAFETGLRTTAVGTAYRRSSLNEMDIKKIRELKGTMTHAKIAKLYGIAQVTTTNIINRKIWKHVK